MEFTIKVARRGQITIPKSVRDELGVEEGHKYRLRALEGGVLLLVPQHGHAVAALSRLRSTLIGNGASLEEMLTELRHMRETSER